MVDNQAGSHRQIDQLISRQAGSGRQSGRQPPTDRPVDAGRQTEVANQAGSHRQIDQLMQAGRQR